MISSHGTQRETFIQVYEACRAYFEPMIVARNHGFDLGTGARKVPRDGHRYQTRGGSIGDRTPQSIAKPPNHARTVTAAAPQGESHA